MGRGRAGGLGGTGLSRELAHVGGEKKGEGGGEKEGKRGSLVFANKALVGRGRARRDYGRVYFGESGGTNWRRVCEDDVDGDPLISPTRAFSDEAAN